LNKLIQGRGLMMKRFVLFLFLISIFTMIRIQVNAEFSFQEARYDQIELDGGFSSILDTFVLDDGSYFLLVYERHYLTDDYETGFAYNEGFYLQKYNPNHELIFNKIIDYQKSLQRIISLDEEGAKVILATNSEQSNLILYDLNTQDIVEIEMEDLKIRHIDDLIAVNKITETKVNDGFLIVGYGYGYYNLAKQDQGMMMKYSANYELEWISLLDINHSAINRVVQVSNDEYIVAGTLFKCEETPHDLCSGRDIGFLAKYDRNGKRLWLEEVDTIPNALIQTEDGHVVVGGEKQINVTNTSNEYVGSVMKVDHIKRDILWETEYYNENMRSKRFILNDIIETEDNELIAVGEIINQDYYLYKEHVNHLKDYDYHYYSIYSTVRPGFIVGFNRDGKTMWESILKQVIYYDIEILNDEEILLTGDIIPTVIKQEVVHRYHRSELYGVVTRTTLNEIDKNVLTKKGSKNYVGLILMLISIPVVIGGGLLGYQEYKKRSNDLKDQPIE
jgi:hypothetical protein